MHKATLPRHGGRSRRRPGVPTPDDPVTGLVGPNRAVRAMEAPLPQLDRRRVNLLAHDETGARGYASSGPPRGRLHCRHAPLHRPPSGTGRDRATVAAMRRGHHAGQRVR